MTKPQSEEGMTKPQAVMSQRKEASIIFAVVEEFLKHYLSICINNPQ